MQVREGSGKGWYAPNRDLAYVMPSLVSKSLHVLGDCEDLPGVTADEMGMMVGRLSKVFIDIAGDKPPTLDETRAMLQAIERDHPAAMREASLSVFMVLMGAYRKWAGEVRPKTPDDAPLDVSGMQRFRTAACNRKGNAIFGVHNHGG